MPRKGKCRLTATPTTTQSGIRLGNLIAIGAAAQANALSGTSVVQILGSCGDISLPSLRLPYPLTRNDRNSMSMNVRY